MQTISQLALRKNMQPELVMLCKLLATRPFFGMVAILVGRMSKSLLKLKALMNSIVLMSLEQTLTMFGAVTMLYYLSMLKSI